MSRWWAAGLLLVSVSASAQAALDAEVNTPYRLSVVLHVREHPLLTRNGVFTDRLKQELRDALQRDLGSAASVEINTTGKHPLLNEILQRGWTALDNQQPAEASKTHFLIVDYVDGQYEIQARQIDGSTGMVSVLRRERTPDRQWVPRLAALTVAQDFGVIGTLEEKETIGKSVRLKIKGSALESQAVRVAPGDIFALALIRQMPDGGQRGIRIPDTLLYVTESREGEFVARRFDRFDPPRPDRTTLGYRAIKLGTTQAPLRLRVINRQTGEPVPGCAVSVSRGGSETDREQLGATNNQGRINSRDTYRNVAFVWLYLQGQLRAQSPIPLLTDQVVDFPIAVTKDVEELARLKYVYDRWRGKVNETGTQLRAQLVDIQAEDDQDKVQEAAKKAQALADLLKEDLGRHRADFEELKKAASAAGPKAKPYFNEGEQLLALLAARHKGVLDYVQLLQNPTPARKFLRQGRLRLASDAPEEAIDLFKRSLKEDPNQPAVAAAVKRLEAGWKIKNDRHKDARTFIYEVWPNLKLEDMPKRMQEANRALQLCQANEDVLTIRKFQRVNEKHASTLDAVLNSISEAPTPEDREKAQLVGQIAEGLAELETRIQEYLAKEQG